jgi:hypothetical protein
VVAVTSERPNPHKRGLEHDLFVKLRRLGHLGIVALEPGETPEPSRTVLRHD